jgi:hypothetical protein
LHEHALTVFTVVIAEATIRDFGLTALQVFPSLPKQLQLRLRAQRSRDSGGCAHGFRDAHEGGALERSLRDIDARGIDRLRIRKSE